MYNKISIGNNKNGDKMKKWYLLLILFIFVGCGKEKEPVSLSKLTEPLTDLETNEFNPDRVVTKTEMSLFSDKMRNVSEEELKEMNLTTDMFEYMLMRCTKEDKKVAFYYILKPKEEMVETVKQNITKYFKTKSNETDEIEKRKIYDEHLEQVYQGYYIYVGTSKNAIAISEITNTGTLVFPYWKKITSEDLEQVNLKKDDMEEYNIQTSGKIDDYSRFYAIRPKKGKENSIKEQLEKEKEKLEEELTGEQLELIKDSIITTVDDTVLWIASTSNNKVLESVKKILQG